MNFAKIDGEKRNTYVYMAGEFCYVKNKQCNDNLFEVHKLSNFFFWYAVFLACSYYFLLLDYFLLAFRLFFYFVFNKKRFLKQY